MSYFQSSEHEQKFNLLISKDQTSTNDLERKAMFYVLSGCDDIFSKGIQNLYDFSEHSIITKGIKKLCLCHSSLCLVNLAFNLYNGIGKMTTQEIFSYLDKENADLALNAIRFRYRI